MHRNHQLIWIFKFWMGHLYSLVAQFPCGRDDEKVSIRATGVLHYMFTPAEMRVYSLSHDSAFLSQMVDPAIRRTLSPKFLSRYADLASLCIQPEILFRPGDHQCLKL